MDDEELLTISSDDVEQSAITIEDVENDTEGMLYRAKTELDRLEQEGVKLYLPMESLKIYGIRCDLLSDEKGRKFRLARIFNPKTGKFDGQIDIRYVKAGAHGAVDDQPR